MRMWPAPKFFLRGAEQDDADIISRLHSENFAHGWSSGEIGRLLAENNTNCAVVDVYGGFRTKRPVGFNMVRTAADEAEILSIAVDRNFRRHGVGRMLVEASLRQLAFDGIERLFLEVDEANYPALALYGRLGFKQVGQRQGYYRDAQGARHTAVVMERMLVD